MKRIDPGIKLGARVRLIDSDTPPLEGVVSSHERFRDGSERWVVLYWHGGEQKRIQVEACEIEAL